MASIRNILFYGLTSFSFASAFKGNQDHCDKHGLNVVGSSSTGKNSGEGFCASKIRDGVLINGIECWSDKNSLRGLKFYYTDGSDMMVGKQFDLSGRVVNGKISWNPTVDTFEWLRLWDNGWDGVIGRIDVKLSNGQRIDCGREAQWGGPKYDADRGAGGMLVAADGGVGDAIDNIRFQFTKTRPSRVTLVKMELPTANGQGLKEDNFKTIRIINHFQNDTLTTGRMEFREKTKRTRTFNFQETQTFGYGMEFGLEVGLPQYGIGASMKNTFEWKTETVTNKTGEDGAEDDQKWSIEPMTIQPGKAKVITVRAIKGEVPNANYKTKMEVTFKDNSKFVYDTLAGIAVSRYSSTTYEYKDETAAEAVSRIGKDTPEIDTEGNIMSEEARKKALADAKDKDEKARLEKEAADKKQQEADRKKEDEEDEEDEDLTEEIKMVKRAISFQA